MPTSTPITPFTTNTAPSQTRSAARASATKLGSPGVSIRLILRSCHRKEVRLEAIDISRDFSSGAESETVVPSATEPSRLIAPASNSRASFSEVLPLPRWPTKATLRILFAASCGMLSPLLGCQLRGNLRGRRGPRQGSSCIGATLPTSVSVSRRVQRRAVRAPPAAAPGGGGRAGARARTAARSRPSRGSCASLRSITSAWASLGTARGELVAHVGGVGHVDLAGQARHERLARRARPRSPRRRSRRRACTSQPPAHA